MPIKISAGGSGQRNSTGLITTIVFITGFLLIAVNYWHAMQCVPSKEAAFSDATDIHIESLERRLLASEAQSEKVALTLKSTLQVIQNKYIHLSAAELSTIEKAAEAESLRIAFGISAQPPPGIPEFPIDPSLNDPNAMSEFVDDFFGQQRSTGEGELFGAEERGEFQFDDFLLPARTPSPNEFESTPLDLPTEQERNTLCHTMKTDYNVLIGVSWGDMSYDLQERWRLYGCDKFFV